MLLVKLKRSVRPKLVSCCARLMKCRSRHGCLKLFKVPQYVKIYQKTSSYRVAAKKLNCHCENTANNSLNTQKKICSNILIFSIYTQTNKRICMCKNNRYRTFQSTFILHSILVALIFFIFENVKFLSFSRHPQLMIFQILSMFTVFERFKHGNSFRVLTIR